jgi:hypothetical protein
MTTTNPALHALRAAVTGRIERGEAEAIIETRVQSFMSWIGDRAMVPVIRDLHESSEALRLAELERARKLLARGDDVDAVLEALSKGLAAKFLHGPQQALHHAQGDERARLGFLTYNIPRATRTTRVHVHQSPSHNATRSDGAWQLSTVCDWWSTGRYSKQPCGADH